MSRWRPTARAVTQGVAPAAPVDDRGHRKRAGREAPEHRTGPREKLGFTLLEVAVALAIVGMGIVTCLQLFSGSLRLQNRASRETRAVLHARAAMDALLFQREIARRVDKNFCTAEGFCTHVVVRRATPEEGAIDRDSDLGLKSDLRLLALEVDVTWQDGQGQKTYALKSLRMAPESDEE